MSAWIHHVFVEVFFISVHLDGYPRCHPLEYQIEVGAKTDDPNPIILVIPICIKISLIRLFEENDERI